MEHEGNPQWPMEVIQEVFNARERDDVLFGSTTQIVMGFGRNRTVVEFSPEIGSIRVTRRNSTREYRGVVPRLVEGGILFDSLDDDEHGYVSPLAFIDNPLWSQAELARGEIAAATSPRRRRR